MSSNEKLLFITKNHDINEESWGGAENKVSSIAFNVPEGMAGSDIEHTHVLKEPRGVNYFDALAEKYPPTTEEESMAIQSLSEYFNSRDHFFNTQNDFKKMESIFGDLLPETQFIIGEPREGNELGFYIIQKRINGETWTKYSQDKSSEQNKEFILSHKEQLTNLVGGARKVLVELGATVDIWGDNLMVDDNENIILIDPGSPSELERNFDLLQKLPKDMRALLATNLMTRLNDLDKYTLALEMSEDEIATMNDALGITNQQYQDAKNRLKNRCDILSK